MKQTEHLGLIKESEDEFYNIKTVNDNLDKIDAALGNAAYLEEITEEEVTRWFVSGGESDDRISSAEIDRMYASEVDYGDGDVGISNGDIDEMYTSEVDYGDGDVGIPNREIDQSYMDEN